MILLLVFVCNVNCIMLSIVMRFALVGDYNEIHIHNSYNRFFFVLLSECNVCVMIWMFRSDYCTKKEGNPYPFVRGPMNYD